MTTFAASPRDPVLVAACRTPIGKLRGALSPVRPDDLLATVFAEAVRRAGVDGSDIDEAFAGCANQAGEDNRNVARMAVLLAGLTRLPEDRGWRDAMLSQPLEVLALLVRSYLPAELARKIRYDAAQQVVYTPSR